MIHTQLCLAQQPVFSMSCDQNIAKFLSQGLMAHFTLSSHLDCLRGAWQALLVHNECFTFWDSPSCTLRTKSHSKGLVCGLPACPFPVSYFCSSFKPNGYVLGFGNLKFS